MAQLSDLNGYGSELEKMLQLRTSPIAVKLLETEGDIPKATIRPKRALDFQLGLCQAFAMSRREGAQVAMLKEDHWCYVPVIAFGLSEPPEIFLEGHTSFPERIADLEAAKRWAHIYPRLDYGRYLGIVSAPLKTANFEPDLVIIYCNSAQLTCLLSGIRYKEGYQVTSILEPGGACVLATIPVIKSGDCHVSVPCIGDRRWALARDEEIIFSVPKSRLEDLMMGLRNCEDRDSGYTAIIPRMMSEYPLPESYVKIGKMIGMDVHE
ncbi:DUF169 domain-containing protein [Chloroflexota bacterium]